MGSQRVGHDWATFTLHLIIASEQAYGGQYPNLQKEEIDAQRIPQTYPWSHMGRYDGNSVLLLWKLSSFSCALLCFILPFPSLLPSSSLSTASLLLFFFSAITQESLFRMYYKEGSSKNQQSPEPQGLQQCLSSRTSSCYTSPSFWQFLLKKIFLMHIFREKSTMNLLYTHHLDSTIIKILFPLSSTSLRSCFNFETEELLHQLY